MEGHRCVACGYPTVMRGPWCPRCFAEVRAESFGPRGIVWSSTVVHVALPERTAPYTLAYVDLSDGPRILAHVRETTSVVPPGTAVEIAGMSVDGDPEVMLL